jgi:hypothetical protein
MGNNSGVLNAGSQHDEGERPRGFSGKRINAVNRTLSNPK